MKVHSYTHSSKLSFQKWINYKHQMWGWGGVQWGGCYAPGEEGKFDFSHLVALYENSGSSP